MSVQTITLDLPETVYQSAKRAADALNRPVEEVLAATLVAVWPPLIDVPPDMVGRLSQLNILPNSELWQAARTTLTPEQQQHLEVLNDKQQREGELTSEERAEQESLLKAYGETILLRAQALLLLKQRGYDVSDLKMLLPTAA